MDPKKKVVVVTGAGGDASGRAIALRFARAGACVVVSDINTRGGRETVRLISAKAGRAVFHRADVRKPTAVRGLIAFAEKSFGGVDVMVNNASGKIVPEVTMDDWYANLEVDLLGALHGVRYAIESMRRRKGKTGGAIVNIGSTSSLGYGPPHSSLPGYDAAKAAIMHLSASLAGLKEEGIRVNCLVPDWIASGDVLAGIAGLTAAERKTWHVPKVLTTPDEIADAVFELATNERLAGRVMVWWSGKKPGFLPIGERGYTCLERAPQK